MSEPGPGVSGTQNEAIYYIWCCVLFLLQFDPQFSLFTEFKYSEKKSFKKYYFEFSQYRLSYHKDTKVCDVTLWNFDEK